MSSATCKHGILNHADMEHFLKYENKRKTIDLCLDAICAEPDLTESQRLRSAVKCCDAICNGIKIFISYKLSQPGTATTLIDTLRLYGKGSICFDDRNGWPFLAERSQQPGMNYKEAILSALDQAHWFFLILPDEQIDRTWTLFEAGYFRRGMLPFSDRLICIHHPSVPTAGPLDSFHSVPATEQNVYKMLDDLLNKNDVMPGMPAVHGDLSDEVLRRHAGEIAQAIVPYRAISRQYLVPYVDVGILDNDASSGSVDILDMNVESFGAMREIFDYIGPSNVPFRNIVSDRQISEVKLWAEPLSKAIWLACRDLAPSVACPSFWGANGCLYRPYVHAIRRYADTGQVASAHIAFNEVVTGPIRNAPAELEALGSALRLGFAFRWEILDAQVLTARDVEVVEQRLRVLELEAMQRGLNRVPSNDPRELEDTILASAFQQQDRRKVASLYSKWHKYRSPDGCGELDTALAERSPDKTRRCLTRLRDLNIEFMKMGSARYAELVSKYWVRDPEPGGS